MAKSCVTNPQFGLTSSEVNHRLAAGLSNTQKVDQSRSLISIIRGNVFNLFNGVVGGCFILLAVMGQWKDTLFGFALLSNLLIGIIQEYSSKRILDRLALLNQPLSRVRRDGTESDIRSELLVIDDIVVLNSGDQILADGVIVELSGLEIDESLLTGESEPVAKSLNDRAFSGCGVVAGSALMRVTEVGASTYAGIITAEARQFTLVNSELRNSLNRLIRWVTWALIPLTLIIVNGQVQSVGGWNVIDRDGWIKVVVQSASSIVSMIPQGLVLITSISFAIAAVALTRRRVLLQELPAVEGLARVDVLCTDKTGTLTDGNVAFDAVHSLGGGSEFGSVDEALALFAAEPAANATALSMLEQFRASSNQVVARVPFSSARKWSSITIGESEQTTWVFGAPELVLDGAGPNHFAVLDDVTALASSGYRTLVLAAARGTSNSTEVLPEGLIPVALVTFTENVRDDAKQTLDYFREQGVTILIISGDNPNTVAAIARKAGIDVENAIDARLLPPDIDALAKILETHRVFGRVTPEQKRSMMAALQSRGHVVAMIGDGVNDALALKHADLGIAMGSGAAATKAVSNLVLLDGRFSSLPGVVDEGRKVIANIERLSRLFLTKTIWAMLLAALFGLLFVSFPILPRQVAAVDFFTIGIPSFLLAFLPNSRRYFPGFLRRALKFCIPAGLATGFAVLVLSWVITVEGTWTLIESQTATALLLGVTGLWVLASLARPLDRWRIAILLTMVASCVIVFTIPFITDFFGFTPLAWIQFQTVLVCGAIANALISITVAVVDRRSRALLATQ
jgi:cation-transporting ATPase E